jgi:hypothetical protein
MPDRAITASSANSHSIAGDELGDAQSPADSVYPADSTLALLRHGARKSPQTDRMPRLSRKGDANVLPSMRSLSGDTEANR